MDIVSLVEHNHLTEMHASLKRKLMESHRNDRARMDSIRVSVLGAVVGENYDFAKDQIKGYVDSKIKYPGFQERAERYVKHCCELIGAIQTKRNFPGLASLALAKQQEIHEKVLEHFEELKHNLKLLEKVEREHRLEDVRSTVWVLRTCVQCVALILVAAFIVDLQSGMLSSVVKVVDVGVDDLSTWMVSLAGY